MNEFKSNVNLLLNAISTLNSEEQTEAFVYLKDAVSNIQTSFMQKTVNKDNCLPIVKISEQCPKCDQMYESKLKFYEHLKQHFDARLTCKICKVVFNNEDAYDYHKKEKFCRYFDISVSNNDLNNFEKYNCRHCKKSFSNKKSFQFHTLQNHATKVEKNNYLCKLCETLFNPKKLFFRHYRKYHCDNKSDVNDAREGIVDNRLASKSKEQTDNQSAEETHNSIMKGDGKCNENDHHDDNRQAGKSDEKLSDNRNDTDDEPKFQCAHCDSFFSKKNLLSNHLKYHFNRKEYICAPCKKIFLQYRYYKRHMMSLTHRNNSNDHGRHTLVKCDLCNKTYPNKNALSIHERLLHNRSGVRKKLSCHVCDFKTIFANSLNRHLAFHTNNRQFVCDECGYCFRTCSALKDHKVYVHTTERNYSCEKCGQTFKLKSGLNRHFKTHSDERNQKCFCGQSYKLATNLRKHQTIAHGKISQKKRVRKLVEEGDGYVINSPPAAIKSSSSANIAIDQRTTNYVSNSNKNDTILTTTGAITTDDGRINNNNNNLCSTVETKIIDDLDIQPMSVLANVDLSCTDEIILQNASAYNFSQFSDFSSPPKQFNNNNNNSNNDNNRNSNNSDGDNIMNINLATPVHFMDSLLQPTRNTIIASDNYLQQQQQQQQLHYLSNAGAMENRISYAQSLCNEPYLQSFHTNERNDSFTDGDLTNHGVSGYLIQNSLDVLNM